MADITISGRVVFANDAPIEGARIQGDGLAFERSFGETRLFVRATRRGDRLYGELGAGAALGYPFVLSLPDGT